MMRGLERRGEQLAHARQRLRLASIAARLREILGGARVDEEDARIIVSGRKLVRRWLGDTEVRFLTRGHE